MIDLNNLIDLLPSYFKEYDSYKDSNGKGLLEKLLNICGEYFQKENLAELDSFLENHSVSGIDELYVNNLWEFLGEFPLLQSDTFNYVTFSQIFKGDNLDEAKSKSRIKSNSVLQDLKSPYTVRNILPYVISLYKIRGTKRFFEILLRLYNLTNVVKIVDSYNDLSADAKKRVPQYLYNSDVAIFKYLPSFDEAKFEDSKYDVEVKCNTCIAQYFEINTSLLGTPIDKYIQAIENLIVKFVPFYINPVFVYTGDKANELYQFSIKVDIPHDLPLSQDTHTNSSLVKGSMPSKVFYYYDKGDLYSPLKTIYPIDCIEANIEINKGYQEYLIGYKTTNSYFLVNPEVRYSTDKPFRIVVSGDYIFIPLNFILSNPSALTQEKINGIPTGMLMYSGNTSGAGFETQLPVRLSITEDIYSSQYNLRGNYAPNSKTQLEQVGDILYYNVYASLDYQITSLLPNGAQQFKNVYLDIKDIICIRTPSGNTLNGSKKSYISQGHTLHYTQFQLNEKGLYTFAIKESPDVRIDVMVNATKEYEEAFNSINLTVNPSTNFIIRNNDYTPGDKTYSSYDSFIAKGVKGAFYVDGTSYKPWDLTIKLNCKTRGGEPKNIVLSSGTTDELIKVDAQGNASYTFPNTLGIYSIYPEGKPEGFTPITLIISAQDDSLGVTSSLRSWYINPSGKLSLEEGSDLSLNAYATIDVSPSGLAANYHPCVVLWKGSVLPTNLSSVTKGTGLPTTPQGQQLLSGGSVVGKIYQLNWYKDNNYSAPIEFSKLSNNDKGNWVTCIVQDINNLKILPIYGRPSSLTVASNQQFNISLLAYVNTNVGFFGIASDKNLWSGLQQNSNSQMASKDVYITGTANWAKGKNSITIIPCSGTLRSQGGSGSSEWTQSPFINLRDSEGHNFEFSNWDDDSTLEDVVARATYDFPLEGSPKTITFYGVKSDGSSENLFNFKLAFPNHVSSITSNKPSQEFPYGTASPISATLKVTSNRLEGPWDIYVNGSNKGKTNAQGEIVLSLAIPGDYNIFADLMGTGSASNSKNPAISLKYTVAPPPKTATPTSNKASSNFTDDFNLTLSCETSGATIYYTTDGTNPTKSSTKYTGPFKVSGKTTTVKAIAVKENYEDSAVASWTYTYVKPTCATPTSSKASGDFLDDFNLTLSTATSGAKIYYTTDGTTPSASSTEYTAAIKISGKTTTIKAIAIKDGYNNSSVGSWTYTYNKPTCATPTASKSNGSYDKGTKVSLSTTTEGANIYYTTDGTNPTSSSTKYAGEITLNSDVTIKAIAIKEGYNNSSIVTFSYTVILPKAATPTASVAAGEVEAGTKVTLSTTTTGATIYYTTNGTNPTSSSTKYTGEITINSNLTIKAVAIASGYRDSDTATFAYHLPVNPIIVETSEDITMTIQAYASVGTLGPVLKTQDITANTRTRVVIGQPLKNSMKNCFKGMKLTYLDITNLDTSPCSCIENFFYGNDQLTEIVGVDKMDVSNVGELTYGGNNPFPYNMQQVFYKCSSLKSLDLSKWNTSKVTEMMGLFMYCSSLTSIKVSNWDISKVNDMQQVFCQCSSLTSLDLSGWVNNPEVEMGGLFDGCTNLKTLDIRNFVPSSRPASDLGAFRNMFNGCTSLTRIKCTQAFKDWCWQQWNSLKLPEAMKEGGSGIWEIV